MGLVEMYPWLAPSFLIITLLILAGAYVSFKAGNFFIMMVLGMAQTLISLFFARSIGPILFGIGLTQFYVGVVNIKRVKEIRHE